VLELGRHLADVDAAFRRVDILEPAAVTESPEAKSVTSSPRSTSPSARSDTTASVPPYFGGGPETTEVR
jgi:hypothetical protein